MSRSLVANLTQGLRRVLAPALSELSRAGRIALTLYEVSRLQKLQREHLESVGRIAVGLVKQGKLSHLGIERLMAKTEQGQRILERHEALLQSYQRRSNVKRVLEEDAKSHRQNLDPV